MLTVPPFALDDRICSPPFMELTSLCGDDTMRLLEQNGLAFPFSTYHAELIRQTFLAMTGVGVFVVPPAFELA